MEFTVFCAGRRECFRDVIRLVVVVVVVIMVAVAVAEVGALKK